jgi:hypothetical protein
MAVSDKVIKDPNFSKAVDAGALLSDKYGRWLGALLYIVTLRSAKPPSSVWKVLIPTVGAVVIAFITKYDWSALIKFVWP